MISMGLVGKSIPDLLACGVRSPWASVRTGPAGRIGAAGMDGTRTGRQTKSGDSAANKPKHFTELAAGGYSLPKGAWVRLLDF
jgi:hypothetical protein